MLCGVLLVILRKWSGHDEVSCDRGAIVVWVSIDLIRAGSTFLLRDSPSPPPWRLPPESFSIRDFF